MMSALPADRAPRLFVAERLVQGATLRLDGAQAHYLISVMRVRTGAPLKLFDDMTGEWLAEVDILGRKDLIVRVAGLLRPREDVPDLWLLAAPIKKGRIDWVAEKACELGVARYRPVITRRTIIERLNLGRLRAHMIEAAEQCERTALPVMDEPVKLGALLASWPEERHLFFADEQGGMPLSKAAPLHCGPAAILIGPEGGFDDEERSLIRALPQAIPVSLGPRILRADTASVAAISLWMAANGDWLG
jgi:16S rRNA (uracil1498-N3)-methyltransferase